MLIYGSEPEYLQEKSHILLTRERKVPRKIFGTTIEDDTWRIRTNRELQTMYEYWYDNRLEWVEHVNVVKFTITTFYNRSYYKMNNDLR